MGYQATTVTPAKMRAQRAGGVAVHDDLAAGRVHAGHPVRVRAARRRPRARTRPGPRARLSSRALAFLPKTRPMAASTSAISMSSSRATTPT